LFTKNVHILIRDGGKRKAGVPAPFSVFGQLGKKGRDVGSKFVGDRGVLRGAWDQGKKGSAIHFGFCLSSSLSLCDLCRGYQVLR
jgi:hypothetical protein